MKTNKTKKACLSVRQGFTFVETILYLAISTIVIGVLFSYGWNMISAKTKAATMRETSAGARLVNERLKREIRLASDIDDALSSFNNSPGKIVLTTSEGVVVIESVGDRISIKRGNGQAKFLTGDNMRIRNFQLSKQVSDSEEVQYVGYSFTAEAYYPQAADRFEYVYSTTVNSGAELRSQ